MKHVLDLLAKAWLVTWRSCLGAAAKDVPFVRESPHFSPA